MRRLILPWVIASVVACGCALPNRAARESVLRGNVNVRTALVLRGLGFGPGSTLDVWLVANRERLRLRLGRELSISIDHEEAAEWDSLRDISNTAIRLTKANRREGGHDAPKEDAR